MRKRVLRVFNFTAMRKRVLLEMYLKQDFRKIRNGWTHKQKIKFEWRKMFTQLKTIFCGVFFLWIMVFKKHGCINWYSLLSLTGDYCLNLQLYWIYIFLNQVLEYLNFQLYFLFSRSNKTSQVLKLVALVKLHKSHNCKIIIHRPKSDIKIEVPFFKCNLLASRWRSALVL